MRYKFFTSIFSIFLIISICILIFAQAKNAKNFNYTKVRSSRFISTKHDKLNNRSLDKVLKDLNIILDAKTVKRWKKILNKALWNQDFWHFFSSAAHFDNCSFHDGIEKIKEIQNEIDVNYQKLQTETNAKKRRELTEKIIFQMGKILHATQDFFAHSNFVEIMQKQFTNIEDVPTPDFWSEIGQKNVLSLVGKGLVSEKFLLSFPKKCPANSSKHIQKDTFKTKAGIVLTNWFNPQNELNFTAFESAMFFAEKATYGVMYQTFIKYPMLTNL